MLSSTDVVFLLALLIWLYIPFAIFQYLFRQKVNIRIVNNYSQYYMLGRSFWLPDQNKSIINNIFRHYYKIMKKPIPKPAYLPFRRDHNIEIQKYNKKYGEIIKNNPKIFGQGFRVMYLKTSIFDLWPKRFYYLSPVYPKRNEYYIYGYPPQKINHTNPRLDHWVIMPDLNILNMDLEEVVNVFMDRTAINRGEIGDQVELSMLGDPELMKEVHSKSTLLNPWVNEKSQVREFIEEMENENVGKDELIELLKDRFGIELQD